MSDLEYNIQRAAELIRAGKLVAFPTETVYGLGANALDPIAVARIFEAKERPSFDPLIVHIASFSELEKLSLSFHDPRVKELARRFWPGPLTMVLPKTDLVPDIVTSGLPTVGIRMPGNEIALKLIKESGCPIAAPSANKFGRVSPTSAAHVSKQLKEVDFILEGGATQVGIESTIIRLHDDGFEVLRPGIITQDEICEVVELSASQSKSAIVAPGMLKSHYSPVKPLYLTDNEHVKDMDKSAGGYISFSGNQCEGYRKVIVAGDGKDLKKYAINIFSAIHEMEDSEVSYIVAESVPDIGIGLAIMDRLKKAAFRHKP